LAVTAVYVNDIDAENGMILGSVVWCHRGVLQNRRVRHNVAAKCAAEPRRLRAEVPLLGS